MLRTIIVDDEELAVEWLARKLTKTGAFEIGLAAHDPREAYEYAKKHPVDVAFLDISMPELGGMRLSSLLRELDRNTEVVFVTGHGEYAIQAFELSALDYLTKPVTDKRLAITLDKLSRLRQSARGPVLELHLFDGWKLRTRQTDALKLRSPKTEELFAYLVCRRTVSREEIADTLWSGLKPENAWTNLNTTLYYIRKTLSANELGHVVQASKYEIQIDEGAVSCDLYEFENLVRQIRQSPEAGDDRFDRAMALYTGPLLKGKAYEWASDKARQLERDYIELLETAARRMRNRPYESLRYLDELLKWDPLREDIVYEAVRQNVELGRKQEALRRYRRLEEMLRLELGAQPDPRLRELMADLAPE